MDAIRASSAWEQAWKSGTREMSRSFSSRRTITRSSLRRTTCADAGVYRLSRSEMCDFGDQHDLEPLEDDEWVLDTPLVHDFVGSARVTIERAASASETCELLEPRFRELLA